MGEVILNTDRFYKNDFVGKEERQFEIYEDYKSEEPKRLFNQAVALLNNFEVELKKEEDSKDYGHDYSVYTGTSGTALLYWYLSKSDLKHFDSKESKEFQERKSLFEDKAASIVDSTLKRLKRKRMSFLCGDAGPLAIGLIINHNNQQKEKTATCLKELLGLQHQVFGKGDPDPFCNEILYGRAGYLYALLFAKQYTTDLIDDALIKKVTDRLISEGKTEKTDEDGILYYEWHDKCYLGAAHGIAGILYILLKAQAFLSAEQVASVQKTSDWLLTQCFPSGNLRSSLGSKDDKLVHWCHGAPGAIYLFLEAHSVFKNEKYLEAARKCADVIWERGLLKRSYSICHGVSGNAYGLMAMYEHTKNEIYLKRSYSLARWCLHYGKKNTREPDRPLSLFEGFAGVIYMLFDFVGPSPKFPAFQL